MNSSQFKHLSLHSSLLKALSEEGYREPTPIQQAAIPEVLAGRDLLATAQTGTGKTAAFALPILHLLTERSERNTKHLRALILTPTRELALQIDENIRAYGRHLPLRTAVVMGGVNQGSQVSALRRNPDILIATPGRLLDLMDQGYIRLDQIEIFVLDEADRMLDMGFIRDVRKIASELPHKRQTLFFSATLSDEILRLAAGILHKPAKVAVSPPASVAGNIAQKVLFVDQADKRELLTGILKDKDVLRALVFTRTKHRAERIMKQLTRSGIPSEAIHSNKSQNARQKALAAFDRGRVKVLVGTDIVARGIDVDGISHVINYEMPNDPESYVHRIGRTARAGAAGIALSFCDAQELPVLKGIEKLTRSILPVFADHPFHSETIAALSARNGFSSGANGRPAQERSSRKSRTPRRFGRKNGSGSRRNKR